MSDPMTDKDETCKGCIHEFQSYGTHPCAGCRVDPQGRLINYYPGLEPNPSPPDPVKQPNHYMICDTEAIDIIQMALSAEEYKGYLFGNVLKYRLRAGKKDSTEQDINKALRYEEMYRKAFGEMPH